MHRLKATILFLFISGACIQAHAHNAADGPKGDQTKSDTLKVDAKPTFVTFGLFQFKASSREEDITKTSGATLD